MKWIILLLSMFCFNLYAEQESVPLETKSIEDQSNESVGFFSLYLDTTFIPAQSFEFEGFAPALAYGKMIEQNSFMIGITGNSSGGGITGRYQYDFLTGSLKPGVEASLFLGAARTKAEKKNDSDYESSSILLAGGAGASLYLKIDVSEKVSTSIRTGIKMKPLTVQAPDFSKNAWLFFIGVGFKWYLY